MSWLLPQLPRTFAEKVIDEFNGDPASRFFTGVEHPQRIYQASGGDRLPDSQLLELRDEIIAIAREFGFPDQPPSRTRNEDYALFEYRVALCLADWEPLGTDHHSVIAETTRRDWWSFLTLIVLPEVACWRWVSETQNNLLKHERFLGGGRNTFQRIHRRVLCFDRGASHAARFGLIHDLKEDDFSAIIERPSLSSSPRIAVILGEELLRMRDRLTAAGWGLGQQEDVYRQAIKDLCTYGIVIAFDVIDDDQLRTLVRDAFIRREIALEPEQLTNTALDEDDSSPGVLGAVRSLFTSSPARMRVTRDGMDYDASWSMSIDGDSARVFYEACGGSRDVRRNPDYSIALPALMLNLLEQGWIIQQVLLETERVRDFPEVDRIIRSDGIVYPITRSDALKIDAIAHLIRHGAASIGRAEGARGKGNAQRRLRLDLRRT